MTRKRKRHSPEQIAAKLRAADAMLNAGEGIADVFQKLEIVESTRRCYGRAREHEPQES